MEATNETPNGEAIEIAADAEEVSLQPKEKPPIAHKDGPFDIAVWHKQLENGRQSIRMELSIYGKDKDGNDERKKVSFWLRDAYAISNRIEMLARQADMRMLVRLNKAA